VKIYRKRDLDANKGDRYEKYAVSNDGYGGHVGLSWKVPYVPMRTCRDANILDARNSEEKRGEREL